MRYLAHILALLVAMQSGLIVAVGAPRGALTCASKSPAPMNCGCCSAADGGLCLCSTDPDDQPAPAPNTPQSSEAPIRELLTTLVGISAAAIVEIAEADGPTGADAASSPSLHSGRTNNERLAVLCVFRT